MAEDPALATTNPADASDTQADSDQSARPDQTTPADQSEHQVHATVEDIGPARKKLSIEIAEARIQDAVHKKFSHVKHQAALPGFRPGKAPDKLLQKRFGGPIREEVMEEILPEAMSQVIRENELQMIGEPELLNQENLKLPESGPLQFELTIEVRPQISLPDFSTLELERPSAHVSDEQVDRELDNFQKQMGQTQDVTEGQVEEGDILTGPAKVLAGEEAGDDAQVLHEVEQANVWVHGEKMDYRGHIAGLVIQDLGQRLVGKSVGDTERVSMTGPEKHEQERVRNQPITVVFTINQLQRVDPLPIDRLVQMSGLEDESSLRESLLRELKERAQQQQSQEMQQQVRDQLDARIEVELPEKILERQAKNAHAQRLNELRQSGADEATIEQESGEPSEQDMETAKDQLKNTFILQVAAEQLDVEVSEGEINQLVVQEAVQNSRRPEELLSQLRENGQLGVIEMQLREQRTLEKITEQVQVTDVDRKPGQSAEANQEQGE